MWINGQPPKPHVIPTQRNSKSVSSKVTPKLYPKTVVLTSIPYKNEAKVDKKWNRNKIEKKISQNRKKKS